MDGLVYPGFVVQDAGPCFLDAGGGGVRVGTKLFAECFIFGGESDQIDVSEGEVGYVQVTLPSKGLHARYMAS